MTELDLALAAQIAESIAREAGRLTLASFRKEHQVTHKATEVDLVTEVDGAAERLIQRRLTQHFPGHGLLAEEGHASTSEGPVERLWIVDPLDGTVNFAHGHPFYCVSMALQVEGELALGVIHAPVLGLTWSARRGGGATRNGAALSVSKATTLIESLCASGFPYDRRTADDNNAREWSAMLRRAQGLRRCGAAALDLAFVADGTYDGFWEKRLNPWDMAAGVLLIEEAGGRVTSLEGEPVPPWPPLVVASNGRIHEELLGALRS